MHKQAEAKVSQSTNACWRSRASGERQWGAIFGGRTNTQIGVQWTAITEHLLLHPRTTTWTEGKNEGETSSKICPLIAFGSP